VSVFGAAFIPVDFFFSVDFLIFLAIINAVLPLRLFSDFVVK
jgi:hypothetical protein